MSDLPAAHARSSPAMPAIATSHGDTRSPGLDSSVRMCLLSMGGELFAIELRNIREVFEVESVTPVPGMPGMLTGVTNLRGTVIPLLDLRAGLGLSVSEITLPFAVVVRHGARQLGLLVDQVPEIRSIPRDHLLPAAHSGPAGARPFVSSVLRVEDRLGGVLEVPQVFAQVDGGETALQNQ
jgi:purine-binding chemotaxis protein CheW